MPLDLSDPRWAHLSPFHGEGAELPRAIGRWLGALGTEAEMDVYFDDLFDLYLHQLTICDASIAVVPWLVHACVRLETDHRATYLAHVAMVEANRLEYGLHTEDTSLVDDLMQDYQASIERARTMADDLVGLRPDAATEAGLVALLPALHGDAARAWRQWLPKTSPDAG